MILTCPKCDAGNELPTTKTVSCGHCKHTFTGLVLSKSKTIREQVGKLNKKQTVLIDRLLIIKCPQCKKSNRLKTVIKCTDCDQVLSGNIFTEKEHQQKSFLPSTSITSEQSKTNTKVLSGDTELKPEWDINQKRIDTIARDKASYSPSSFTLKDRLKQYLKTGTVVLSLGGAMYASDSFIFSDFRYSVTIEYSIVESCLSSYREPLSRRHFANKQKVCVCALEQTMLSAKYNEDQVRTDQFFEEFEFNAELCHNDLQP